MFIDVHGHAFRDPYPGKQGEPVFSTPQQLMVRYDELNIEKAALLPIVNPEVYLPQSNEEILAICAEWPERFFPFCNIDPRAYTNSSDAPLTQLLEHYKKRGCKGLGEVMPNLPILHPLVRNLFRCAEKADLPLTVDMSTFMDRGYGLYDDPGLPQLEYSLRIFPKLRIIGHGPPFWAEIGELETPGDRAGYPSYPFTKEGVVPKLFRRYSNLYADLSAGSGYNALARNLSYAPIFLEEFQDRLMYGTDICGHTQPVPIGDLLIQLRDEGKISSTVFEKVARLNAKKLFDLS
ncbi:MAG: amidohydrolase family protein [Candidatus Ratteibacteria bacterium]|jgi:predicted TIM-barrel fold metal-dependent hydrolase